MTVDYNDGKIHGWNGGDCPVHPESLVNYWMSAGEFSCKAAGTLNWLHNSDEYDIIAFRVIEQHVEPKTVWVNEYADGAAVHYAEESAKQQASSHAIRIAVEYREVKSPKGGEVKK